MADLNSRIAGVQLKLDRAKHHIFDVDGRIRNFIDKKPYTISSKPHPIAEIQHTTVFFASVEPVPNQIALIIGDDIHNLRSSLDYLACQLVTAGGGTVHNGTSFPICKSAQKYRAAMKRRPIEGMRFGAQKLIRSVQRDISLDDTLWHIHELDRIDKHRLLIAATLGVGRWGLQHPPIGKTIWLHEGTWVPAARGQQIVNFPTRTWERQAKNDFTVALEVAFNEPASLQGEPVVETLYSMAAFSDDLIERFGKYLI